VKNATDIIAGKKPIKDLGIVKIDESSVRIELERPAPFILEILAQPIAAHCILESSKLSFRFNT